MLREQQFKNIWNTQLILEGNINKSAKSSWIITLSPPDLCFYPTGGLCKPCFYSNTWCIQVLAAVKLPDQLQGSTHPIQPVFISGKFKFLSVQYLF